MTEESRSWMIQAACRGEDPEIFFPTTSRTATIRTAAAICASCPVQRECALYAENTNSHHGIWAGQYRNQPGYHSIIDLKPCGTPAAHRRHLRRNEKPCRRCQEASSLDKREREHGRKANR
jgi:WhiB family redox-sensing transcriptional regulator